MAERRNFVRPVLLHLSAGPGGQIFSFRRETHEKTVTVPAAGAGNGVQPHAGGTGGGQAELPELL